MTTEAKIGYGTTLTWHGETVVELTRIGAVKLSVTKVDSTTLSSPDFYKEFIPGLLDPGDVEIEGLFRPDDAGQTALKTDMEARTSHSFTIAFPTALSTTTWTGTAYITAFEAGDVTIEGMIPFTAMMSIVGKPTLGVTASAGLTTPWFAISESAVIVPSPAGAVYNYVATVLTGITSVTVTPTAATGIITVQGNTVASGNASSPITLGAAGSITEITIIVTETGKSPKTYTIWLTRAAA